MEKNSLSGKVLNDGKTNVLGQLYTRGHSEGVDLRIALRNPINKEKGIHLKKQKAIRREFKLQLSCRERGREKDILWF